MLLYLICSRFSDSLFGHHVEFSLRLIQHSFICRILFAIAGVEGSGLHPRLVQLVLRAVLEGGHELFVNLADRLLISQINKIWLNL